MTKSAEVSQLDATIAAFGQASYIGPWLAENRLAIVADIQNDLPVCTMLPAAARREAADIIARADARAEALISSARAEAKKITDAAYNQAQDQRESIRAFLRRELSRADSI